MLTMYPACFYKEDEGYSVIFPDLNYLATQGESFEDAMEMAVDCLAGYIYWLKEDGAAIPQPSKIGDVDAVAVANELSPDESIGEYLVNMVSVDVEAYAKDYFNKSVRKTLTIPSWLNDAALAHGINFSRTLQEALVTKLSGIKAR